MKYWHRRLHLVIWIITLLLLSGAFIMFVGIIQHNNLQGSINGTGINGTNINATTELPNFLEWEEELDSIKKEEEEVEQK